MAIALSLNAACLNKWQPFWFFAQEDIESSLCIYQQSFFFIFFVNSCGLRVRPSFQRLLHQRASFWGAVFRKGGWSAVPGSQTHVDISSWLQTTQAGCSGSGSGSVLCLRHSSRCQHPADSCPIRRKMFTAKSRFHSQISNLLRISIKIFVPCTSSMISLYCCVSQPSWREMAL